MNLIRVADYQVFRSVTESTAHLNTVGLAEFRKIQTPWRSFPDRFAGHYGEEQESQNAIEKVIVSFARPSKIYGQLKLQ